MDNKVHPVADLTPKNMRACLASGPDFSFHPSIFMNAQHFITHKTLFRPAEEGSVLLRITIPISQSIHCSAGLLCYLSNGVYVCLLSNVPIQTKAIWVFKASVNVKRIIFKVSVLIPSGAAPQGPSSE